MPIRGCGRGWRRAQQGGVCPRRIDHFLEPCLLLLLHCTEGHGYELLDELKAFGFGENPVDSSTVYRILRGLEEEEVVASRWDAGDAGPARRLYHLTDQGDRFLASWVEDLRATDAVLHHFLEAYDAHMARHA